MRAARAFVVRTLRAMRLLASDSRIPKPLRWLALLGLLPIPGPLDEALLLLLAPILFVFHRQPMRDAWLKAGASDPRLATMSLHLFAGLRVRDFEAARPWYERLFGEPSFLPHATEAVWTLADDRSVYVVEHPAGAGNSVVTIFLDDLDAHVAAVAARGLEPDERLTYTNGVRKTLYRDPDGNELGFGGAPLDTGA